MAEFTFALIGDPMPPERLTGELGVLIICVGALWLLFRRVASGPPPAEPWGEEITRQLEEEDCTPLCHHCLTPHPPLVHFCPECGAAVGPYTNMMPVLYWLSMGHALRVGTNENFRRSPLTLSGFVLTGSTVFGLGVSIPFFAPLYCPVYWFQLARNVERRESSPPPIPVDPPPEDPPATAT